MTAAALAVLLAGCGARSGLPQAGEGDAGDVVPDASFDAGFDAGRDECPSAGTVPVWRCGTVDETLASCAGLCRDDVTGCSADDDCTLLDFVEPVDGEPQPGVLAVLRAREDEVRGRIGAGCDARYEGGCVSIPECPPSAAARCVDGACEAVDDTFCGF